MHAEKKSGVGILEPFEVAATRVNNMLFLDP